MLQQIGDKVESEAETTEFLGETGFVPHLVSDCFADRTLKLSGTGESSRSWVESHVDGLGHINLNSGDWHVHDNNYGTDQEKPFVKYFNDHAERPSEMHDESFLVRNEKAVKTFSFAGGHGFEPDYMLFLGKMAETASTILQMLMEPKVDQLLESDSWKPDFLGEIAGQGTVQTIFRGQDHSAYGLPFFNDSRNGMRIFRDAFEQFPV